MRLSLVLLKLLVLRPSNRADKLTVGLLDLDSLQVDRVHHRSLEEFHSREVSLDESFKLQVWRLSMEEDNLNVDVFAILVEEILEKVADTFVCDVATNDDVSIVELSAQFRC